jgi:hypothetical protein
VEGFSFPSILSIRRELGELSERRKRMLWEELRLYTLKIVIEWFPRQKKRAANYSGSGAWHALEDLARHEWDPAASRYYRYSTEQEKQAFMDLFDTWRQGKLEVGITVPREW